jgi:prepilin-type N-terminal cleavage/methylation domain-containing protein
MSASRRGFTLVELLAVIAIVLILMTLVVPLIGRMVDTGRQVRCMNSMRQIGIAVFMFGADHEGLVPGGDAQSLQGPEPWEKCWMGREVFPNADERLSPTSLWPKRVDNDGYGTLIPYIGGWWEAQGDKPVGLYRCIALPKGPVLNGRVGSNGYFDFAIVHEFCGASISLIPGNSTIRPDATRNDPATWVEKLTPLVVEEDPANSINAGFWSAPSHGNTDKIGVWHNGKGNYLARDGSAQSLKPLGVATNNPGMKEWYARTPSGAISSLGGTMRYGQWNKK